MPTKDEAALELAKKHYEIDVGLKQIFRLRGSADVEVNPAEPIKLLEVSEDTIPSGVMPVQFGPAPLAGVPYPSIIVEVTPEEFERIKKKELPLPQGWELADLLPKPVQGNGEA